MRYTTRYAVYVAALVAVAGCGTRHRSKPRLGEVERLPRLETVAPHARKLLVVRSYTATVEPFEKAELCAQVRGYIASMPASTDIGRPIKKGEELIKLDIPDVLAERDNKKALVEQNENLLAQATQAIEVASAEVKESQAQVQKYEADEEYRKRQHIRVVKLAQGDTVSQQLAEETQLQLGAAQAAKSAALAQVVTKNARLQAAHKEKAVTESRVKVAKEELARVQAQVDFASIRAPFDGIITKRWVDSGATVKDAGMPLVTVMRTDYLRVLIDIPERDVPYIKGSAQGNAVELRIPALEELGVPPLKARITTMAAALDPVTRTMRAEIHLDNRAGEKAGYLKAQMTGTAKVVLAERQALTVPSSALVRSGNKMEVYIVADASGDPLRGTVKRLEVQLGLDDGLHTEIRSERLTGRELVIMRGAGVVQPGEEAIAVPTRLPEVP